MGKQNKAAGQAGQPSVLIVDDEQMLARSLARFLEKKGCRSLVCHSGQEALKTIRKTHFDVILMDRELPDADGLELIRSLRKTPSLSRIFILSAHPPEPAEEKSHKALLIKHIQKPFDLDTLYAAIFAS